MIDQLDESSLGRELEQIANNFLTPVRTRRGLFAEAASTATVAFLLSQMPLRAAGGKLWIEDEKNWFPYDPEAAAVARRRLGSQPYLLPSLHEEGGSLHIYDIAHAKKIGNIPDSSEVPEFVVDNFHGLGQIPVRGAEANARGLQQGYVEKYLRDYPLSAPWAGGCRELAIIGFEPEPSEFVDPELKGLGIDRTTRVGLLIFKHMSDAALIYKEDKEGIKSLLRRANQGYRVIIKTREPGMPGIWYRAVQEANSDHTMAIASNFGFGVREVKLDQIASAEIPAHIRYHYGMLMHDRYDPRIERRSAERFGENPHRNEKLIDLMVYGTTFDPLTTY